MENSFCKLGFELELDPKLNVDWMHDACLASCDRVKRERVG